MLIQLAEWLRLGHISPLRWGATARNLVECWPTAQVEIDQRQAWGCPFIVLDKVDFYFATDPFEDLYEVRIGVCDIAKNATSAYFDYGWLHKELTNSQVQVILQAQGIAYQVDRGLVFRRPTPNLRTVQGALFSFDSNFKTEADAKLMSIYIKTNRILEIGGLGNIAAVSP